MSSKIVDYTLVSNFIYAETESSCSATFTATIQMYLQQGWTLHGETILFKGSSEYGTPGFHVFQALKKEKE